MFRKLFKKRRLGDVLALVREEAVPWLREPAKKPLRAQVREAAEMWRANRYPPLHYFRARLYRAGAGDPAAHVPWRLLREFQQAVNAGQTPQIRALIRDKAAFRARMEAMGLPTARELLVVRGPRDIRDADGAALSRGEAEARLSAHGGDLFAKPLAGMQGKGALRLRPGDDLSALFDGGSEGGSWIVQPALVQHPRLAEIHPASVNTIRIDTLWMEGRAVTSAASLRMGRRGSLVDNGSSGGIAANVSIESGRVLTGACHETKFDPLRRIHTVHPDTGARIEGLEIPHWEAVRELVARGAEAFLPTRSLGWDVAIGENGPVLLEVNEDFDVMIMQATAPIGGTPFGRAALAWWLEGTVPAVEATDAAAGRTETPG